MSNPLLESLFTANATSAKLLKTESGSWRRLGTNDTDHEEVIPHEYGDDNIFVVGVVTVVNSESPTEKFHFSLPYVNALGQNIVSATWDETNVYIEFPWTGETGEPAGSYTDYDYDTLIMLV